MSQVFLNRRRLGFGAITGSLYYYLGPSCTFSDVLRKMYGGMSSIFARIGTINMLLIAIVLVMRYTRFCGLVSASFNQLWLTAGLNCLFFSLKLITFFKIVIASARDLIRLRKLAIIELKSDELVKSSDHLEQKIRYIRDMNNVCLICLGELADIDFLDGKNIKLHHSTKKNKIVLLNCGHVFHYDCFKTWFLTSGSCPYCRRKI